MNSPLCTEREIADDIKNWITEKVRAANADGCVIGVSGGLDSAVVALLCKRAFPQNTLGLIMPCHSPNIDKTYALKLLSKFDVNYNIVELDKAYNELIAECDKIYLDDSKQHMAVRGNLKARLRMATLYFHSNLFNYLVVGTGNLTERLLGYYTKYGDGACDIMPIGGLFKGQVYNLARELDVPQEIIDRIPTASLYEGQTDEGELGMKYEDIDKMFKYMRDSEHKRVDIPRFVP